MKLIDQEKDMNILAKREMNLEVNLGKLQKRKKLTMKYCKRTEKDSQWMVISCLIATGLSTLKESSLDSMKL